jgi:branched-chain amino acid transport system substrate-binding protein
MACSITLDVDNECQHDDDCRPDLICEESLCVTRPTPPASCKTVYGVEPSQALNHDVIQVGMLMPTTGELGPVGLAMELAVGLAAVEINQSGGIDGRSFAVISCDTGTDTEQAVLAAQWLIEGARVPAIIGPARSTVALEVFNRVAHSRETLVMSPSATSPALSEVRDDDLLWRTVPTDQSQGAAIFQLMRDQGHQRIGVLNIDDTYGNGLRGAIEIPLCAAGLCSEDTYMSRRFDLGNEGATGGQWNQVVEQFQVFNPDVIVFIGFVTSGISFLEKIAASETLRDTPIICTDGMSNKKALEEITDQNGLRVLANVIGTRPASPTGEVFQTFAASYRNLWNTPPEVYNANAYDAMYLLGFAIGGIAEGEVVDGPRIAQQIRRMSEASPAVSAGQNSWGRGLSIIRRDGSGFDFEGASGPLDFDENGEATSSIEAWYFDLDNGRVASHGVIYTADGEFVPGVIVDN